MPGTGFGDKIEVLIDDTEFFILITINFIVL